MNNLFRKSKEIYRKEQILSMLIRLTIALVMIGAATLILILFENLISVNIYFVYLAVGIILGLSVIVIISTFSKKNEN